MSTFLGIVEELPGISVDRFDGENLNSSAYFLSHCHVDHMSGLSRRFFDLLEEKRRILYCTPLSRDFIEGRFELSETQSSRTIRTIAPCSPAIVDYTNTEGTPKSVTVLGVPAGHCPGSVMFIFEAPKLLILYTGDFRIAASDLPRLKPLHYIAGTRMLPKKFDKIYLDTTFLDGDYRDFPSRERSLEAISKAALDWISRDPKNVVSLECSATYGSEFVYMELADKLRKRVHVKPWVYQSYSRIPELERCITNNAGSTPVHACVGKRRKGSLGFQKCRQDVEAENVLTIVPSALRWKGRDLSKGFSEWDKREDRRFYVCLSMHCSYNELKAFLNYFEPRSVYGCVDPRDSGKSIQDTLAELTKKSEKKVCQAKTYKLECLHSSNPKRPRVESKYFRDDSSD